ncbi:MAG TPA: hypothetical protein VKE69_14350 [Planctomycetota bacterium]|nr:hypothetical protein [Planctomycetota bacterium]
MATLATERALRAPELRDPGDLPELEERFVRDFDLPDSKRQLVRAILREYRDRRREIEGRTAAAARDELARAGREADAKLRGILTPPQRAAYDARISPPREPLAAGSQAAPPTR